MHFDHLKPYYPETWFHNHIPNTNDNNKGVSREETHFGLRLELIDGEENAETCAEPSQGDVGGEFEGVGSEPEEDPAEPDAIKITHYNLLEIGTLWTGIQLTLHTDLVTE